jgi:hypothetical protein
MKISMVVFLVVFCELLKYHVYLNFGCCSQIHKQAGDSDPEGGPEEQIVWTEQPPYDGE